MSSEGSESEYGESDVELEVETADSRESTNPTNPLPESSKDKYMAVYNTFLTWKESKLPNSSFSESVLMEYFVELNAKVKPSTLWSHYSMLKSTLKFLHDVDISQYTELLGFIKKENEGFISTKAKELTSEDIQRFLTEAPDREYLATKVVLIFGIAGGCRSNELTNLTVENIENHGRLLLVKIPTRKGHKDPQSFIIEGEFYDIVKQYEALRPAHVPTNRFFLNYQRGKCTQQVIGKNKISRMPKQIARFLNLPDANSYTGHSFHRTSKVIGNTATDLMVKKCRSTLKFVQLAKKLATDPLNDRRETVTAASISPPSSVSTEDPDYELPLPPLVPVKHRKTRSNVTPASSWTEDPDYEPTPSKLRKIKNVIVTPTTSQPDRARDADIKSEEIHITESNDDIDELVDEYAVLDHDTNYFIRPGTSTIHEMNQSAASNDSSGSTITIPELNKSITFKNCTNVTIHIHNHNVPNH